MSAWLGKLPEPASFERFRASVPEQSHFPTHLPGLLGDLAFENAIVERVTISLIAHERALSMADELRHLAVQVSAR